MRAASVLLLLVVPATSLHVRDTDACSCIGWKSVYTNHGVRCGQGYELGTQGEGADHVALVLTMAMSFGRNPVYEEFCTRFYMQASFPKCLNKRFGAPAEQWCYVSSECEGAERVEGTNVAIHTCTEGDDTMMKTSPEELNKLALTDNLDIGLFGKLSYNMEPEKWSEVEGASGLSEDKMRQCHTMESFEGIVWTGAKVPDLQTTDKFTRVKGSHIPTIFDADNGHGGGTLIVGMKIYAFMRMGDTERGLGYVCVKD